METGIILTVILGLAIIAVGIYQIRTGQSRVYDVPSAFQAYRRAWELVSTYAPAADQLYKIGELPKDQRLDYVIGMVLSFMDDLDIEQIRGIVEGYLATEKQAAGE